jgi:glycosyltransferase involved in cell wall biosynthesis
MYIIVIALNLSISIIIPIYNEEKRIRRGLDRILDYCNKQKWEFEIIVVEDGSSDSSAKIVNEFSLKDDRVKLLSLGKRYGKGGSILKAIESCKKDKIGFIDVDLSTDPSEFSKLIRYGDEFDIVVGSRILRGTLGPIKRPLYRSILSFTYSKISACLFDTKLQDLQCGFKLFKRDSILKILSSIKTNGFAFDTEFLVKSSLYGLKIKEEPIIWQHDYGSKLNVYKAVFHMSKDLILIWIDVLKIQNTERTIPINYFLARPIIFSKLFSSKSKLLKPLKQKIEAS